MGVSINVQFTNRAGAMADQVIEGVVRGETKAGERLLALTQEQVPMELATLAGSGTVVPAQDAEQGAKVVYDTPYAARLHEHPEYHFSTAANPGAKGKYVEDPALENRKELGDIIRKEAQGNA